MMFFKTKNFGKKTSGIFIFFVLILGLSVQAIGQESTRSLTRPPMDLSKLSDEQWVKEMDGLFNLLRYLDDADELRIIKAQLGLTDEQMAAFEKYREAYTHTSMAAKNTTADDWRVSVQERDKRASERSEKAKQEQIRQAHEFRKIISPKDIDLREWGLESGAIFVSLTNALEERRNKTDYAEPGKFSDYVVKKITSQDFYQEYLFRKKAEFQNDTDFNSFVLRHELQIKDRAAIEACNQSIQFIGIKNKTALKNISAKKKELFQKLMAD